MKLFFEKAEEEKKSQSLMLDINSFSAGMNMVSLWQTGLWR